MVSITHAWKKNSDIMNTGFRVSIGETGQQPEKIKKKKKIFIKSKKFP